MKIGFLLYLSGMCKNLVFTSAGDKTNFHKLWTGKEQHFDLIVYYYGNNNERFIEYAKVAKYIEKSKGLKFQNFHKFWNTHPALAQSYDRYFILDDDLIFNMEDINRMFEYSEKYNLKICQPSFTNPQWFKIVRHVPNVILAYTNFCEVTAPLFTLEALQKFLMFYDPILQEFGVDCLFMRANDHRHEKDYAVIHDIKCYNPVPGEKGEIREINTFSHHTERPKIWREWIKQKGFQDYYTQTVYSEIMKELSQQTPRFSWTSLALHEEHHDGKQLTLDPPRKHTPASNALVALSFVTLQTGEVPVRSIQDHYQVRNLP